MPSRRAYRRRHTPLGCVGGSVVLFCSDSRTFSVIIHGYILSPSCGCAYGEYKCYRYCGFGQGRCETLNP